MRYYEYFLIRNTWRRYTFMAVPFLISLFSLIAILTPQHAVSGNWNLYRSDLHGFELSYPNDWRIVKTKDDSVVSLQNRSSGFSIRIANLRMNEKQLLNEMGKVNNEFITELRNRFPDAITIFNQRTALGGRPSNCIVIQYSLKNIDTVIRIKSATITCPKGVKLYTVQFDSLADEFSDNYHQFQKIIATFSFR